MDSIETAYLEKTPRSRAAFERAGRVMPSVAKGAYYYAPYPVVIDHAEGCHLYDIDGNRYTDFANHHTAQILGHRHPAVLEAAEEQMRRGIAVGAPTGVETELAEELCRRVPSLEKVRFCNSGTEATLHAIRLARGFSGRPKIAKFEGAYHGSHDAVEISVAPDVTKAGPADAPLPVPTTGGMSPRAVEEIIILPYDDETAVERLVATHWSELACVLLDPRAGVLPPRPEFVRAVREITRIHSVLLVFDEIVGFRAGTGGIQEVYGIVPDLSTYGKIVGGGFPVGAFGGRKDIMALLDPAQGPTGFSQSGTFSAHPVTMAAGLAMLRQLTPEAFAHLNALTDRLTTRLQMGFDDAGFAAQIVSSASAFSVYFTDRVPRTYRDLDATDKRNVRRVFLSLLNQGYYLSAGLAMNSLSLPMTEAHIDRLTEATIKAIGEGQS
ncbi:MAG: aminotransferase class III-fold pyridoxal phosphate-dependent enzyme [candidate division Zixibacteria bacterium]|nr:aminotransferase class III-fold pyridoxal phosphate-dependent enzyme [candidate division Zixibacteria bacterium]